MNKSKIIIVAGVVFVLVVVGFTYIGKNDGKMSHESQNQVITEQTQEVKPNTVLIKDFDYATQKLTIKKGTTVTWVNKDEAHHDITPTSGADDFKASKLLAQGESYQFTFNEVGSYNYKCSPHPYMTASIEVTE